MRATWIIVPAIGLGLMVSACSGGSASSTSGDSLGGVVGGGAAAPGAAAPSAAGSGSAAHAPAAPGVAGAGVTAVHLSPASIIYTAELTVRAGDVTTAADQATRITEDAGGYVSGESLSNGDNASATVTLKIPAAVYPRTLGDLAARLGKRLGLQQQAQDVTQQITDVNSQVTSYLAAIAQLRALLSHAGSVGDLLSVQNQINDEENSLEQLQAQQRSLSQQTSYATVTVTIVPPAAAPPRVVHHKAASTPGLTRGLKAGWHALRTVFSWTLAILGALAPFLAIAAVATFAAYRARRWLLHRRAPVQQPES